MMYSNTTRRREADTIGDVSNMETVNEEVVMVHEDIVMKIEIKEEHVVESNESYCSVKLENIKSEDINSDFEEQEFIHIQRAKTKVEGNLPKNLSNHVEEIKSCGYQNSDYKTEQQSFRQNHVGGKVGVCDLEVKTEQTLEVQAHPNPERKIYKCQDCRYSTTSKLNIKRHGIRHKNPAEFVMFKCDMCPFETKYKRSLVRHFLYHKDLQQSVEVEPNSDKIYKCQNCSYSTTSKLNIKKHVIRYKNPAVLVMFKCVICPFETKYRCNLTRHSLTHKDLQQVMIKCGRCPFVTKYKHSLLQHSLTHKDPQQLVMHKCQYCNHVTKYKRGLTTHMLIHKDKHEVKMYECDLCPFKSKHRTSYYKHGKIHEDVDKLDFK